MDAHTLGCWISATEHSLSSTARSNSQVSASYHLILFPFPGMATFLVKPSSWLFPLPTSASIVHHANEPPLLLPFIVVVDVVLIVLVVAATLVVSGEMMIHHF